VTVDTATEARPALPALLAETLGTALLVAIVIGSGIAAQSLSPGQTGLQLLQNSVATTLGLGVLIAVFGPLSGAHFNPVVTVADDLLARRPARARVARIAGYLAEQFVGGVLGALLASVMFALPPRLSSQDRATPAHLIAEVVATAGLVIVVFVLQRTGRGHWAAPAVAAYIGAAYWFTSSTSFANPAVTVARMFTDTFAGISPASVTPFVIAQVVGGVVGVGAVILLVPRPSTADSPAPTDS